MRSAVLMHESTLESNPGIVDILSQKEETGGPQQSTWPLLSILTQFCLV